MIKKVEMTIEKNNLIKSGDKILVGLSGGADSTSLLHVLKKMQEKYDVEIHAVHINHMVRGEEADRDESFSKKLCKDLNVKYHVRRVDMKVLAKKLKITDEEAGRKIRYDAFNEILESEDLNKIAVAHNKNDNAETFIFRLLRGTGTKGLRAIEYKRGNVIRPLLDCSRDEIEKYCLENNIEYIVDSTNLENDYTRNKIRNVLIPFVNEKMKTNAVDQISKAISSISEQEQYVNDKIDEVIKDILVEDIKNKIVISKNKVNKLSGFEKKKVISKIINKLKSDKDFERRHYDIVSDFLKQQTGKKIDLPNNLEIRISYDNVIFEKITNESSFERIELEFGIEYKTPKFKAKVEYVVDENKNYDLYIPEDIVTNFYLRTREAGDFINVCGRKKLKDFFINKKIDRNERDGIILLTNGKEVLYIETNIYNDKYKEKLENIRYIGITIN